MNTSTTSPGFSPVTIPLANATRRLHSSSLPAVVVDRRIPTAEAIESAQRLAAAAIGPGERARISIPAKPTDDDCVVLAFIYQRSVARPSGPILTLASHCNEAMDSLAQVLESQAPTAADDDVIGAAQLATFASHLIAQGPKSKAPAFVNDPDKLPQARRDRLLLAASMLVRAAARMTRESAANPV